MRLLLSGLALLAMGVGMSGCGSSDGEPDAATAKKTAEQSDRLQQIQNLTQGDWNKLTPADKDYLVNQISHGSESTAKILLDGPPKKK